VRKISELDGVRGIAILLVLLFHAAPQDLVSNLHLPEPVAGAASLLLYPVATLGWAGVDLFFVLSGFLITTILLQAKAGPRYFRNFYARRFLRIFPIYYASLFMLTIVVPLLKPSAHAIAPHDRVLFLFYLQNWLETFQTYTGFRSGFLAHFWSLAVEEQFYLVWPLAVYLLTPRQLMRLCAGLIAASLLVRIAVNVLVPNPWVDFNLVHFNTIARFDTLAMGALIACATMHYEAALAQVWSKRRATVVLVALGLALLGILLLSPSLPHVTNAAFRTVGYSVLAAGWAVFLLRALRAPPEAFTRRALRIRALTYTGAISYGLYVFHYPVFGAVAALMRRPGFQGHPLVVSLATPVLALSLTFAAASLSFRFFESPILSLKRRFV